MQARRVAGVPLKQTGKRIVLDRPNTRYYLTEDLTFERSGIWVANAGITLDLNGHTIRAAQNPDAQNKSGIRLYLHWKDKGLFGQRPDPKQFTLLGPGKVITGGTARNHAVSGERGYGATISGATLEVAAKDSSAVYFNYSSCIIERALLVSHVRRTDNRHAMPAVVHAPTVFANHCAVIGGNLGFTAGSESVIRNCFISTDAYATNPYAVGLYRCQNARVEGNLSLPVGGRGVLLNAGRGHTIRNNVLLAWELPNKEYGNALNATAIRSRYGSQRHVVTGNICLAVGGAEYVGASALYLSDAPGTKNHFVRNHFAAVLAGTPRHIDHYAKAITLEAQGAPPMKGRNGAVTQRHSLDRIAENILVSNHYLLSVSGRDSWQRGAWNTPLENNQFYLREGDVIIANFVAVARKRWEDLALQQPEAKERFEQILAKLQALPDAPMRPDAAQVWGDSVQWHTPAGVTVRGSGPYDDWNVLLRQHPKWKMDVALEPASTANPDAAESRSEIVR